MSVFPNWERGWSAVPHSFQIKSKSFYLHVQDIEQIEYTYFSLTHNEVDNYSATKK